MEIVMAAGRTTVGYVLPVRTCNYVGGPAKKEKANMHTQNYADQNSPEQPRRI